MILLIIILLILFYLITRPIKEHLWNSYPLINTPHLFWNSTRYSGPNPSYDIRGDPYIRPNPYLSPWLNSSW